MAVIYGKSAAVHSQKNGWQKPEPTNVYVTDFL